MALELGSTETPEKKNDHASGAGKHSGGARFAWADNGQSNGAQVERGSSSHALHEAQMATKIIANMITCVEPLHITVPTGEVVLDQAMKKMIGYGDICDGIYLFKTTK
ncbi:hypothetical protein SESBI_36581 [Sesbania bispinosa]|nr:hypothetical protein SESBI_36581 [Sesbania bispinosa]